MSRVLTCLELQVILECTIFILVTDYVSYGPNSTDLSLNQPAYDQLRIPREENLNICTSRDLPRVNFQSQSPILGQHGIARVLVLAASYHTVSSFNSAEKKHRNPTLLFEKGREVVKAKGTKISQEVSRDAFSPSQDLVSKPVAPCKHGAVECGLQPQLHTTCGGRFKFFRCG
ncbi:hypothetical protein VNO77_21343 [Canavalia gladiata]|uniref:Uncharacterized protein n=1 Tax=Canavalia gladiata TaxID=3824 RepID=A0AAN9LR74_CANGL